jgi:uncharacterized protein YifE (UPF0438 family)
MAESFTTTNRFFDNKHYPRGFSRHGDFTIKEAQLLERHGYAFNELELGKRDLSPKMKNSLFRYAVVNVSQQLKQNASGLSIWRALSVQSVSIRCPAVSRRWKVLKTTPKAMIKKKGVSPFFMPAFFADGSANVDRAIAQRLLQMWRSMSVHPPYRQWFGPLSANAARRV